MWIFTLESNILLLFLKLVAMINELGNLYPREMLQLYNTDFERSKLSRLPGMCWWWVGRCPGHWQSAARRVCWRPELRSAGCLAACPPPLWWPYGCPCWGPSAARSSCRMLPCSSARRAQLQQGTQVGRKNFRLDSECHVNVSLLDLETQTVDFCCMWKSDAILSHTVYIIQKSTGSCSVDGIFSVDKPGRNFLQFPSRTTK